jgi:RHS repeat-associated protein
VTTATAGGHYTYDVIANDPDGDTLTYSLTTAPTGMTIDSLGQITWSPQIADIGNHSVDLLVSDVRGPTVSQQYTIAVVPDTAPTVLLTLSSNPVNLSTPDMAIVSATDNVGVTQVTLTVNGTPVPLDSMDRATLPDNTAGDFTVVATASNAAGLVSTDSQTLVVVNPQVTNAPVVALTTPADGDTVTAPTQVIGTVQDPNLLSYTLSVAPIGSQNFTTFFTGTTQVANGVLGTFDPTLLQNNSYDLRLTATNTGGLSSTADVTVNVSDNLKLGNFTLSFTDLSIPVAGIPITIARTYDTLTANQSQDFGFGWRLEFRDVSLQTSVASTGSEADGFFNPFNTRTKVYVTLPGGQREGFTFQPQVQSGLAGSFLGMFEPNFVPDAGVKDSLAVSPANLRLDDNGNASDFFTGLPYNPADPNFGGSYLLTTKDGIAYNIDGITGQITTVSDPNNNTLTFSDAGVVSTIGTTVAFERDPEGRISAIVDPMGQRISYQYDANGNLVAVTDRTGNTTQFVYISTPAHYLDHVIDPLGRTGLRTNYDAQGRLVKVIDAAGNPIQIAYDPTHSLQTDYDQLGNPTTYEYDDHGNLVKEIDALGNVTTQTFDANNNKLSETDPLGRTITYTYNDRGDVLSQTDPLGNTTFSTYQAFTFGTTALAASRGQAAAPFTRIQTYVDPLGNTTSFAYDFFGNPVSTTNADGDVASIASAANGVPLSLTDATGSTTQFVYDAAGNVVQQVDALGNTTDYTYDADGNQLTQTSTRTQADGTVLTLTTQIEYDSQGRIIAVTDPEGGVTRTEYDAAGNKTAIIDALGRRIEYVYDDRNKLIETIYPDNTHTQIEYDADGRQTATIDELGRRTEYQYDALGRLIKTIYPDGTSTETEYDADGEVTAQIDALGNRTEFEYDADGRQIVQRDALGDTTTTAYDAGSRPIATTDPRGFTTTFVYDGAGHLIETDYPDGTKTTSTYNARGQETSSTDQLNHTTQYEYDALGQLTAVMDALNQRTEYVYDEAGNLVSRTDANGHTTTYEYDNLGRQTATDLPALPGQQLFRSTTTYDAVGNVVSTTDFNGNTITYSYDARNRLIAKNYPDGTSVTYTYTLTGQVATVTDARGTTRYAYDDRDRLLSRTDPDGTVISYTYDADGDRTSVTIPAGTATYTFDALNRMATVTDPDGALTSYTYDADGNLTKTDFPNGTVETRTYDSLDRLTFLEDSNSAGVIASYTYIIGPTGLHDADVENTGRRVDYTYDALNRLTEEKITDPNSGNRTIDYTYDAVGNRLTMADSVAGITTYSYDAMDRLTTETLAGQVTQYTYDKNGNTVSCVSPTGTTFYTWDFDNRLISADTNSIVDETNVYDPAGNLVSQTIGGKETRFLIDTVQPYAEVLMEYQPGGSIAASYVYGIRLISQDRAGVKSFYLVDNLGSTRELTNGSGVVTDRYVYDSFGIILAQSGSTVNNYLFTGERRDLTLGFDYLRARYSNFTTGRFLTRDPADPVLREPSTGNPYIYGSDNPVSFVDPSGRDDFSVEGLGIASAILLTLAAEYAPFAIQIITHGGRFPDALGFGAFYALTTEVKAGPGGIGGVELVLAPRLKQYAVFAFGGVEAAGDIPTTPDKKHFFHQEAGVFQAWYWNVSALETEAFTIPAGISGPGVFEAVGKDEFLFGATTDNKLQYFGITGVTKLVYGPVNASEASLAGMAILGSAAVGAAMAIRTSGTVSPGFGGGVALASILQVLTTALWVHFTYGKTD